MGVPEVVLACCAQDGFSALMLAPPALRGDKAIALAAVGNTASALRSFRHSSKTRCNLHVRVLQMLDDSVVSY